MNMGKLYVVPTPVGNLEDMTFRAIRILKEVDLILAEDTRTSGILLKHFEIKNAMQSHHKFNEHKTVESVVNRIKAGETVRIRANYSPENASLDFGLVDSNEKFHYINVTTGSIDKTIEIPENGDYTLAIRNNSSKSVKVTGDVRY